MNLLLAGAATFLLENMAALGIDKGSEGIMNRLSEKALLNADESIRAYLMDHLSDYEYEKIDSFLASQGVYSHDQAAINWSIMSTQTEEIIENFYHTYPALKYNSLALTPLLKHAIETAYQSVISHLGTDARILYHQATQHRAQIRSEHQDLADRVNNVEQLLSKLTKKLSYAEVIKVYDVLSLVIHSGNFSSADTLIQLMESQIDERDRSYCTALKIYLRSFIGSQDEADTYCTQYLRESPPHTLTTLVATFLLQMDDKSALKIIHPIIQEQTLAMIVRDWIVGTLKNAIAHIVDANGKLKTEYATTEYALWAFANYSRLTGDKSATLEALSLIERIAPTAWSRWATQEAKALLAITDSLINVNFNIAALKSQVECVLSFGDFFASLREELCYEYVDTLLTCARSLDLKDFDFYYEKLSQRMKAWDRTKGHWYAAHLSHCDSIEEVEIQSFCEKTSNRNLWAAYLYRHATDSPEFVIRQIEDHQELLQEEFTAILAYSDAISATKGDEAAYNTIAALSPPKAMAFSCNIYLTEFSARLANGKANAYLQAAVDEALHPSSDISVSDLRILISLLVNMNRWPDASQILEKYQDRDPALMLLRLNVLMSHKEQCEICSTLISKLESIYSNNAYFQYCKGLIAEYDLPGSGEEFFEKAFRLQPCPQYAHNTLTSRLNRKTYVEDDILAYASSHDDVDLLHICGITYARYGKHHQSNMSLLQALVNCGGQYHETLYSTFTGQQLGASGHETPPPTIEPGTCCVLSTVDKQTVLKLWIHDDNIRLPHQDTNFAGYQHISPNSQTAFLLLGRAQGDTVKLSDSDYEVIAINYGDVIAVQHCTKLLLEHGVMKQISVDENDISAFFEEVRKSGEERSEHINNILDKYRSFDPGLTLELFSTGVGNPYYKAVYALINDASIPFWAGSDGYVIDNNCILTPSIIATLSSLDIHPPVHNHGSAQFYVTNALKADLELQSREHRSDRTSAILGFSSDGRPYMIENTAESKRTMNLYYGCLNEWACWAIPLATVSPREYPHEIKGVAEAIGIPNIEAIVNAQKGTFLICCDDLLLRRYMYTIGIQSPTTIDVLLSLGYPYEHILDAASKLIARNYITPLTPNFLRWVSEQFRQTQNEDELEKRALPFIDLIKKALEQAETRTNILHIYQQHIHDDTSLHPTLRWIIRKSLIDYFSSANPK